MKYVSYTLKDPDIRRLGAIQDNKVIDLNKAYQRMLEANRLCSKESAQNIANTILPPDLKALLQNGDIGKNAVNEVMDFVNENNVTDKDYIVDISDITIKTPMERPNSLRDFLSFEEHLINSLKREVPQVWYDIPIYYKGNADTIIGPDETCVWPEYSDKMDYELEFACVIGKEGINISKEEAGEYIAGYTILNDFSARDAQMLEMEGLLGPAKGKDFCTAIGPYLVTPDEIDDVYNMEMIARVNGEVWSKGNTNTMHRTFEEIIEYVSKSEPLKPGDVLGSGTVGKGCGLELGKYLKSGDVVELEIPPLGKLRNKVVKK